MRTHGAIEMKHTSKYAREAEVGLVLKKKISRGVWTFHHRHEKRLINICGQLHCYINECI